MDFNPCGLAVEWGRRPYTTWARLHDSEDAPLVRLIWYVTDLPFMENETVVTSNDWDEEPWRPRVVGEVYGASRDYNGRERVVGLHGDHHCGKLSEFEQGQPWPYTGPPVEYGEDNIPLCCPRDTLVHATAGASAELTTPNGYTRAPQAGSSVDYLTGLPPSASVTAGTSVQALGLTEHATAGSSVDFGIPNVLALSVTGGAGVDINTPHNTCETAEDFEPETTVTTVLQFVNQVWWYFTTLTPDADYFFDFTRFASDGSINVWAGGCEALVSLIGGYDFNGSGHHLFTAPSDGRVWVLVTSFGSPTYEWTIYPA